MQTDRDERKNRLCRMIKEECEGGGGLKNSGRERSGGIDTRRTGQRNGGVGRHNRERDVAEISQGKDREGGGPVSLYDRKEGHHNLSY